MSSNRLLVLIGAAAASTVVLLLAACGDDREAVTSNDAGGALPDAPASLPEAAAPFDASTDAGRPAFDASDEPVACASAPCAVELVAGAAHFCARMSDGTVRCWGDDTSGALGRGDSDAGALGKPEAAVGLDGIVQLSAARATTCALDAAGVAHCWGSNADGQLGLSESPATVDGDRHATPSAVATSVAFSRVDVGARIVCGLAKSGGAVCWGANDQQQLARPDAGNAHQGPGPAPLLGDAVTRSGGAPYTSYALTSDGALVTWGEVAGDRCLSGREASISPDPAPAAIPTLSGVTAFAAGERHVCALVNGAVACWGGYEPPWMPPFGALCTGWSRGEVEPAPASVDSLSPAQRIAVSSRVTCVRLVDGSVHCCGANDKGQLDDGDAGAIVRTFVPVSAFKGHAVSIAVANDAICALLQGGTVECWGGNDRGQLGRGGRDDDPHPQPAPVAF